jgi:phosphohistidine phosphatase
VEQILAAAGWPGGDGAVVIVGHSPAISQIGALLLTNNPGEWTLKKAGVWWFSNRGGDGDGDGEPQVVLETAMSPRILKLRKS